MLLRAIAGVATADAGRIRVDGHAVQGPGLNQDFAFQEHPLLPWLSVEDNIAFGLGPSIKAAGNEEAPRYGKLVGARAF